MATVSFSPDAIRELRDFLGPTADEIIPTLQDVIAAYPEAKTFVERDFYRQWDEGIRQLRSLSAALQEAQRYFDPRDPDTQPAWLDDLDRLDAHVTEQIATIERLFDLPQAGTRGKPRNEPRRWLANLVAYVLQSHGVPITKTHGGGLFHKVLMLVIEAAEGQLPPDDLFPLTRETVDLFRTVTTEQLAAMDVRLIGLMRQRRLKGLLDQSKVS